MDPHADGAPGAGRRARLCRARTACPPDRRPAVVLHDIGKPATTRHEAGKLTSRGHSARGEILARAALWHLGAPFAVREHVCALIRHHQTPFFGLDKPADEAIRLARRMSLVLRHDWLTAVADADARGRRCADPADQTRIVDACALWAEHARELAVLDRAQPFASSHSRRVWSESATRSPDVAAYDNTTCEVIVMAGLPASGKDSWLAALALVLIPLLAILVRIHVEEAALTGALGEQYSTYAGRTRRLVPGLW